MSQSDSTVARMLTLHVADPVSNPGTPYGFPDSCQGDPWLQNQEYALNTAGFGPKPKINNNNNNNSKNSWNNIKVVMIV